MTATGNRLAIIANAFRTVPISGHRRHALTLFVGSILAEFAGLGPAARHDAAGLGALALPVLEFGRLEQLVVLVLQARPSR